VPVSASELTVVIPTRDRWAILRRTLDGLAAQTVTGFEVVVVVDGKDCEPPPLPDARVVVADKGGPGHARNAGIARTDRPLVLFLGDDMIPTPVLVARHLESHADHPEPESAVLGLSQWHPEVRRNGVIRWMSWAAVQFDYEHIDGDEGGWGRFYSSNVSLKREFFLEVGGFDDDFEYDYEDLDFGYRAQERGMHLWYQPAALAQHLHDYDLEKLARRYASHAKGERVMQAKHTWFTPYFAQRVVTATSQPPVSSVWTVAAEVVPSRFAAAKARYRERSEIWFHQQVGPSFLAAWQGEDDLAELKEYLGADFDERILWTHQAALDEEMDRVGDETAFYRTSEKYLYDLTAFAMWSTKRPYFDALKSVVPAGARLLDYGCGIGSDGLRLRAEGYQVGFADFANPSTKYLRWRLDRRGSDAPVYDIDKDVPGGFDAAYSFDVIEHVDDPFAFLERLEDRADIVAVNLLEPDPDDTHLHRPLPIRAIVNRAEGQGLLHYRRYHGRSHLIIYRSQGPGGLASHRERARGEAARRIEPLAATARRLLTGPSLGPRLPW
jgi:GT2 family glycosyltransferase